MAHTVLSGGLRYPHTDHFLAAGALCPSGSGPYGPPLWPGRPRSLGGRHRWERPGVSDGPSLRGRAFLWDTGWRACPGSGSLDNGRLRPGLFDRPRCGPCGEAGRLRRSYRVAEWHVRFDPGGCPTGSIAELSIAALRR